MRGVVLNQKHIYYVFVLHVCRYFCLHFVQNGNHRERRTPILSSPVYIVIPSFIWKTACFTNPPEQWTATCPPDFQWIPEAGNCYLASPGPVFQTWTEAALFCMQRSSTLVSLNDTNSQVDMARVLSLAGEDPSEERIDRSGKWRMRGTKDFIGSGDVEKQPIRRPHFIKGSDFWLVPSDRCLLIGAGGWRSDRSNHSFVIMPFHRLAFIATCDTNNIARVMHRYCC